MTAPQKGFAHVMLLAGIVMVALLAVSVYFLFFANQSQTVQAPASNSSQTANVQPQLTLSLEAPQNGTVVTDKKVEVKGNTLPGAVVVIYTDSEQTSVDADAQGNFDASLNLDDGINTITVTAYDDQGNEKSAQVDVVSDTAGK